MAIKLQFDADTRTAIRKLNEMVSKQEAGMKDMRRTTEHEGEKMERQWAEVNRSISRMSPTLKKIGTAVGAMATTAIYVVGRFSKSALDAFGKQQDAEKRLETALGRVNQKLLDHAAALQKVTTYGDETIIEAEALIAAFVKDEDQIQAATDATLDLAAAKGMDLVAAADLVSKTLGSTTNALSRYGIEVTGAVGSTERLSTLTDAIAGKFGGQAKAAAETYTGAMAQLSNEFGDLEEKIGGHLAPIMVDTLIPVLRNVTEEMSQWIDKNDELIQQKVEDTIQTIGDVASTTGTALDIAATAAAAYADGLKGISDTMDEGSDSFLDWMLGTDRLTVSQAELNGRLRESGKIARSGYIPTMDEMIAKQNELNMATEEYDPEAAFVAGQEELADTLHIMRGILNIEQARSVETMKINMGTGRIHKSTIGLGDILKKNKKTLDAVGRSTGQVGKGTKQLGAEWSAVGSGITEMLFDSNKSAQDLLKTFAKMIVKMLIMKALRSAFGMPFHTGGMITGSVPSSAKAPPGTPKYAGGGGIGLRSDERMIKVELGESVLNRMATASLGARGVAALNSGMGVTGSTQVNIHIDSVIGTEDYVFDHIMPAIKKGVTELNMESWASDSVRAGRLSA